MKNYFLLILILLIVCSCKTKESNKPGIQVGKSESVIEEKIVEKGTETKEIEDWKHKDYFKFKNYKEYRLKDTIVIDLNGNGILENVYFDSTECPKILINENGQELISIGCDKDEYVGFPNSVGWVDLWCVVQDNEVWEVLFKEDGDIDTDTIVKLERPSIYIGKEEAGGGIITYRNGKLYWIHQSD